MSSRTYCLALLMILAPTAAGCAVASRIGSHTTAHAPGGELVLFNGTNLAGWKVHCKPEDGSKVYWRAEDDCIVADSLADANHDYVWLATEREYGDFELRLKFQAFRDSPGNSGVQIRSRYDEAAGWLDGPQLDIHPPVPWRTGMIYDETRGVQKWIARSVPKVTDVKSEMAAPNLVFHYSDQTPSWNELEITARGTRIRAVLNGVVVQDWDATGVPSILGLMDTALPTAEQETVRRAVERHLIEGAEYHALRTRQSGARRFVSMHVLVPGSWTVHQGHELLERIEAELRAALPMLTAMTHLEPGGPGRARRPRPRPGLIAAATPSRVRSPAAT